MLVGLRKAWADLKLKDEALMYGAFSGKSKASLTFHHEELEVYQTALDFIGWFVVKAGHDGLTHRLLRRLDEAATCVVLNIAEGNGRYSELDQRRFLETADSGAIKAAVCIDLCVKEGIWKETKASEGKTYLERVSILLAGF